MGEHIPHPPSPCDNSCEIDPDTGWCDACFRTIDEVLAWPVMTAPEKEKLLAKIEVRRNVSPD